MVHGRRLSTAAPHDASPRAPSASVNTRGFFDNHHARPTQRSADLNVSSPFVPSSVRGAPHPGGRGRVFTEIHWVWYVHVFFRPAPSLSFPRSLSSLLPPLHRAGADVVLTGSTRRTIPAIPALPALPRPAITRDGGRAGRGGVRPPMGVARIVCRDDSQGPSSDADDARRDQDI
ncbi:hypothetical protein DFH08DRAFT_898167 [Mycena albidolilacea]|uniref:Uncharacterized protein n=1 Tax=Mycena albidolilacea TaxID=1033008 RepID=A0AAD6Z7D6_9AGAR|nr:hypothetical protein DFH08DRAFT_898167 [Mycena albidolilacea]